jgi:hypothetical protein
MWWSSYTTCVDVARRLLTVAASGGLGSPPARRARRANLHHWHSTGFLLATFYVISTLLSWTHDQGKRPKKC